MNTCCLCPKSDDLTCPICDKLFCISCFVDHGKSCYEQTKQGEKRCTACGRYASVKPLVHCSDCRGEYCRSCLYAHRKTHEEHAEICTVCQKAINPKNYMMCPECRKRFHANCYTQHRQEERRKQQQDPSTGNFCVNCGKPKNWGGRFTICPSCHAPVCFACENVHTYNHTKSFARCSTCGKRTKTECDTCHMPLCTDCFPAHNRTMHDPTFGRINFDDIKIEWSMGVDPDFLKKQTEEMRRVREEVEAERKRKEEQMRTCPLCQRKYAQLITCPECKQQFCAGCYPNHAYNHRMKRQQEDFFNNFYGFNRERTSGTATAQPTTQAAFQLLGLSQRATVQEVKHAFRRLAKTTHPDVGGSKEAFIKLNNAYEMALKQAERNER